MKTYKDIKVNILEQASNKSVVFTFGRFQPPTSGHQLLINKVIKEAEKRGAEHRIYPSHSHDKKSNPLSHKDKVLYMRKLFTKANIIDDKKAKTPFQVLTALEKDGFNNVYMVVGGDRVSEFKTRMSKYADAFDTFEVISAGKRDPDAEGVVGMSGSKMRKAAADKEFESFLKGVPDKTSKTVTLNLFRAIRKGMGLKEQVSPIGNALKCPPPASDCGDNSFCMCTDDNGVVWECDNLPGSGCVWVKCTHNCGPKSNDDEININKIASKQHSKQYNVRVADTGASRAKGLMHETYLDENDGMLFVFEDEDYHGIWMKNTHIPLDCVWINESGIIVDIKRLHPHNLDTRYPSSPAKYVLEVNAGTFDGAVGDTLAERTSPLPKATEFSVVYSYKDKDHKFVTKLTNLGGKVDRKKKEVRFDFDSAAARTKFRKKNKKVLSNLNVGQGVWLGKESVELDESVNDNFENFLTELSIQSRRKMARAAKRTAKRRAAKRKIKARRMKGAGELKKKAQNQALRGFRDKILKGRSWATLSYSEKENVSKRMKKKYTPAKIAKKARKLLPGIRKGERERITGIRGGKNEQYEYLKINNPSWSNKKAMAIATANLQEDSMFMVERNYKSEYANYQGKPEQVARRSSRNKARRKLEAQGRVRKGDGKDVDHKNRNPLNNGDGNLRVQKKEHNRSFSRKSESKFYQGKREALEDGTNRARRMYQEITPGQHHWFGDPDINRFK